MFFTYAETTVVPAGKAVMIHKGMDPGRFSNITPMSRKDLGIPDNAILACWPISAYKGSQVPDQRNLPYESGFAGTFIFLIGRA